VNIGLENFHWILLIDLNNVCLCSIDINKVCLCSIELNRVKHHGWISTPLEGIFLLGQLDGD